VLHLLCEFAMHNQSMQLTASKLAVYTRSVCRRDPMLRGMQRGLAATDLWAR